MKPPLCRYCARPIGKRVDRVRFGCSPGDAERHPRTMRVERPVNKAEAQRYGNGEVVRVAYSTSASVPAEPALTERFGGSGWTYAKVDRYVSEASYWDGESYLSEFFCRDICARDFGYAAARHPSGIAMPAYHEAIKARGGS